MQKQAPVKFRVYAEGRMQPVKKLVFGKDLIAYTGDVMFVRNPEHLMMFTGYQDINGTNVYEGDLLAWPEGHEYHETDPMPVVFDYGVFQLDGSAIWDYANWIKKGSNKYTSPTYRLEELEVVGHIYDGSIGNEQG